MSGVLRTPHCTGLPLPLPWQQNHRVPCFFLARGPASLQDASAFAGEGEELSFLQLQARAASVRQASPGSAGPGSAALQLLPRHYCWLALRSAGPELAEHTPL